MKPRNREVNIFNMSVLDLLTGALGAFCFLTLALFPSYYKTQRASPATASDTANKEPAKPGPEVKGLEGPVPPFAFMLVGTHRRCASLEVTQASSVSGSDLASFAEDTSHTSLFLFAFQAAAYHVTIRATPFRTPCEVSLSLENPNNNWTKTEPITDTQHPVEFDFNLLSTDLNSNLWDNG